MLLTEEDAKAKITEIIEANPKMGQYQYKIECQLSHCRDFNSKMTLLAGMMKERSDALFGALIDLKRMVKELEDVSDGRSN